MDFKWKKIVLLITKCESDMNFHSGTLKQNQLVMTYEFEYVCFVFFYILTVCISRISQRTFKFVHKSNMRRELKWKWIEIIHCVLHEV